MRLWANDTGKRYFRVDSGRNLFVGNRPPKPVVNSTLDLLHGTALGKSYLEYMV